MKNVYVLTKFDDPLTQEAWGSLTEICEKREDWSYHYLKRQKLPMKYKGWLINRVSWRAMSDPGTEG